MGLHHHNKIVYHNNNILLCVEGCMKTFHGFCTEFSRFYFNWFDRTYELMVNYCQWVKLWLLWSICGSPILEIVHLSYVSHILLWKCCYLNWFIFIDRWIVYRILKTVDIILSYLHEEPIKNYCNWHLMW